MANLNSTIINGDLEVKNNTILKDKISISGTENIEEDINNLSNAWIQFIDSDGQIKMGMDDNEIVLSDEFKIITGGNGLKVDSQIKENGIPLKDTYLTKMDARNNFNQIPLDNIKGTITAYDNQLYTSGLFNNITDLNLAKIEQYGKSSIITTPTNKFNCIINNSNIYFCHNFINEFSGFVIEPEFSGDWEYSYSENRLNIKSLYNGNSGFIRYRTKNVISEEKHILPSTYNFIVHKTSTGKFGFKLSYGYVVFDTEDMTYYEIENPQHAYKVIRFDNINDEYYVSLYVENTPENHVDFISITPSFEIEIPTEIGTEISYTIESIICNQELITPEVPPHFIFPDGTISFEKTENLNIKNMSFLWKGVLSNKDGVNTNTLLIKDNKYFIRFFHNETESTNFYYSESSHINSDTDISITSAPTKILSIGKLASGTSSTYNFHQLIAYSGSKTKEELILELEKNLHIYGEIEIINKIYDNMHNRALLGIDVFYNIEDGKEWTSGDVVYNKEDNKYYKCLPEKDNNDDFIDLSKWKKMTLEELDDKSRNIKIVTQTEYDALGTDVLTDDIIYLIIEEV